MTDEKHEGPGLRELVVKDLTSQDDDARRAFDNEFGSEVPAFADAATKALEVWSQFRDSIEDTDERTNSLVPPRCVVDSSPWTM